jgi:hypothetical protein
VRLVVIGRHLKRNQDIKFPILNKHGLPFFLCVWVESSPKMRKPKLLLEMAESVETRRIEIGQNTGTGRPRCYLLLSIVMVTHYYSSEIEASCDKTFPCKAGKKTFDPAISQKRTLEC